MKRILLVTLFFFTGIITCIAQTTLIPDTAFEQRLIDLGLDNAIDGEVLTANISSVFTLNINDIPIADLTGIEDFNALENLFARNTNITNLDLSSNVNLFFLSINSTSNSYQTINLSNTNVSQIVLVTPNLTSINVTNATNLSSLDLSNTNLSSLDVSNTNISSLTINNLTSTSLTVISTNLLTLDINNSNISSLDVSSNTNLSSLDVSSNTNLSSLDASNTNLSSLDVSSNSNLLSIDVSNTLISILTINNLTSTSLTVISTNLLTLDVNNSNLSSLDVSSNASLSSLNASNTNLSTLDVSSNSSLSSLDVSNTNLSTLDVSSNSNLSTLDVSSISSLMILNIDGLNLTELEVDNTNITTLDLSAHTNLTKLQVNNNTSITELNVQNGFNSNLGSSTFLSFLTPNLTCIQVDDVAYSNANWNNKDAANVFSTSCTRATAFNFDGIDDYAVALDPAVLDIASGTIEMRIKPKAKTTSQTILAYRNSNGSSTKYLFNLLGNLSGIGFWNGVTYQTISYNFTEDEWYNISIIDDDSGSSTVTINGATIGAFASEFGTATGTDLNLYVGVDFPLNEYFKGDIGDIRIWNTILPNGSDICNIMPSQTGLLAHYSFDQGFDSINNTGVNTILDRSTNTNNLLLLNTALTGTTSNWVATENTIAISSRLYVNINATGLNNGSSWTNAFIDLQDAISLASSCNSVTEIWVAAGTYTPSAPPRNFDRNVLADVEKLNTFHLVDGVAIYGGFSGTETNLSERDISVNKTILSGEIGDMNQLNDNIYHVVVSVNDSNAPILDGITIRDGYAFLEFEVIISPGPSARNASMRIPPFEVIIESFTEVIIEGVTINYINGAGILLINSNAKVKNTIITNNTAVQNLATGGVFIGGSSSTLFDNVLIDANTNVFGGASGIYALTNGNAIFNNITLTNGLGSGGLNANSNTTVNNSVFYNNQNDDIVGTITGTNNYYQDGTSNAGFTLLTQDPFVDSTDVDGADNILGTLDDGLIPAIGSVLINAGDTTLNTGSTDILGRARIQGGTIDVGAYETRGDFIYENSAWSPNDPSDVNKPASFDDNVIVRENVTVSSNFSAHDLTIDPGVTLSLASGVSVHLDNDCDGEINGPDARVIAQSQSNSNTWNLDGSTIGVLELANASLTTTGSYRITASLYNNDTNSTSTLNVSGADVTLGSTATQTALIDGALIEVIGELTVEKYFNDKRAYRFISSPVTTPTSIYDNWQEAGLNLGDAGYLSGYGTHISGNGGASNGFDVTGSNNTSMFSWDNINQNWAAQASTDAVTDLLVAGQFSRLFVRGDRDVDLTNNNSSSSTTLRTKGSLLNSSYTVPQISNNAGDFMIVGNPYQSKFDLGLEMNNLFNGSSTNINAVDSQFYYVWDPLANTRGSYRTYSRSTNSMIGASPVNSNYDEAGVLQPGQAAFFVASGTTGGTFTINRTTNTTPLSPLSVANILNGQLQISLYETGQFQQGQGSLDGLLVRFENGAQNTVDNNDAIKFNNLDENLGRAHSSGQILSIESRDIPQNNEVLPLEINNLRHANYTIEVQPVGFTSKQAILKDNFNNTLTPLDNNQVTIYSYSINAANSSSIATVRFEVLFEDVTLGIGEGNLVSQAISIYPNPVLGPEFYIDFGNITGFKKVTIYNALGQKINTYNTEESSVYELKSDALATGMYVIEIEKGDAKFVEQLIVK